jgi:hypothetical protein
LFFENPAGILSLPRALWDICILITSFTSFNVGRSTYIHHLFVRRLVNYDECYPPLIGEVPENVPSIYF